MPGEPVAEAAAAPAGDADADAPGGAGDAGVEAPGGGGDGDAAGAWDVAAVVGVADALRVALPLTTLGAIDGVAGTLGVIDAELDGDTPGGSAEGLTVPVAVLDGETPGGSGDGVAEGAYTADPPPSVLAPAGPAAGAALDSVTDPHGGRAESPAAAVNDALTCNAVAANNTGHGKNACQLLCKPAGSMAVGAVAKLDGALLTP